MAQSGPGKIRLFDDFCGVEIPVDIAVAYGDSAGYYIGPYSIKGDLVQTDRGAVALGVTSGAVRIDGGNENGKGVGICTDLVFNPVLNGPLVCEARVQMQALTTRSIFVGFCGTMADDLAEPITSVTATHTLTATDTVGFVFDSQLTTPATKWHACYNGGTRTGATSAAVTTTGITPVLSEWDVLRVEVDPNGTARYYVNGNLESTVTDAATVTTTDMLGVIVGCFGTAVAVADLDVDYVLVNANRDWTR